MAIHLNLIAHTNATNLHGSFSHDAKQPGDFKVLAIFPYNFLRCLFSLLIHLNDYCHIGFL
jgi:hypothetical protein